MNVSKEDFLFSYQLKVNVEFSLFFVFSSIDTCYDVRLMELVPTICQSYLVLTEWKRSNVRRYCGNL